MEDISETPPQDIDPYTTLNLTSSATTADIKTAYKRLALRHHPDKAPPSEKSTAHSTFQTIAFAYAILSSPHRRTLYDTTGSTSETLSSSEDFNWLSFFRTQYSALSASALTSLSTSYKASAEERKDVLGMYTKHKGKMGKVYEEVMLSNPLEDEDRFREIIDEAIEKGEVQAYDSYVKESKKSKDARMRKARKEAEDAEKEAKSNKRYQSIFGGDGKGGRDIINGSAVAAEDEGPQTNGATSSSKAKKANGGKGDISDLAAMIQSRQQSRSDEFFDKLEARYAGGSKGKKRKAVEEPDEEAFERTKAKMAKGKVERGGRGEQGNGKVGKGTSKAGRVVVHDKDDDATDEEEEGGDIDLEKGSDGDEEEEEEEEEKESEEEVEVEEVKPKRRGAQKGKPKTAAAAPPPAPKKKMPTRARGRGKK
ncbi:MAG: hypothetical protein Q9184_004556 [Pyrenodesmia sp. 2 TL-2023]